MSRIGKKPVAVPAGVTATVAGQKVTVKGPKGELAFTCPDQIKVAKTADGVEVSPARGHQAGARHVGHVAHPDRQPDRGRHQGLRADAGDPRRRLPRRHEGQGRIQLQVGYSHDVVHKVPAGLDVKVAGAKQEQVTVSGIDKQKVGHFAAELRASRPPEPYQGKGVRYQGEYIFRKEGKKK